MNDIYKKSGVDIKAGDDFSDFAFRIGKATWTASPFVDVIDLGSGHFRGPRGLRFKNLPEGYLLDCAPDGVGTKIPISIEALTHDRIPYDIIAMTCSDILRWGGIPLVFCNVFDVSKIERRMFNVIESLGQVCQEQGVVMYRGETAELGPLVGSENPDQEMKFNWAGFAIGAYNPKHVLRGDTIEEGDLVLALKEPGFRSNGLSAVRRGFRKKFGEKWWENPEAKGAIRAAAEPSDLYLPFLRRILGWDSPDFQPLVELKSLVHISGGGIVGKFGEDILFPLGLSAMLDKLYQPPGIMYYSMLWSGMSQREAYRTWNGGQGFLAIATPEQAEKFCMYATFGKLDVKPVGHIVKESRPRLVIHSTFGGEVLEYFPDQKD